MYKSKARLDYLFSRFCEKKADTDELVEFFEWLRHAPAEKQLSSLVIRLWENAAFLPPLFSAEKSEEMVNIILRTEENVHTSIKIKNNPNMWSSIPGKWAKVAATLLIISTTSLLYIWQWRPKQIKVVQTKLTQDILPGGNKATLILSNGKKISLDHTPNGVLASQGSVQITKSSNGQLICNFSRSVAGVQSTADNIISTPNGGQYQIVLADGSRVWINAASSLRFPPVFKNGMRKVEVSGEAYFEVAKNPQLPFIVKTKYAEVQVMGTHFNVKAYDDETTSKTTLLEGAVKIGNGYSSKIMHAGEQALLDDQGQIKIINGINTSDEVAWKNGLFAFNGANIKEVMNQVARWYDVSIAYEGKMPENQITGSISRNVKASELMMMLSYTGVNFRIDGKKITVLNSN